MDDLGLIDILKNWYVPIGVTPIAICQQCISLAILMVNIVSWLVLKSKNPFVLKFHFGVRLKLLLKFKLDETLDSYPL